MRKFFTTESPIHFGHPEKRPDQNEKVNFNCLCHKLGNKLLQCTYYTISQEVKAIIRQQNLLSQYNVTRETFFLKNHTQNVVEKLF